MAIQRWEMLLSAQTDCYLLKIQGDRQDVDRILLAHPKTCQTAQEISGDVFKWVIFVVDAPLSERLAIQNQVMSLTTDTTGTKPSEELLDVLDGLSGALQDLTNLTDDEQAFVMNKMARMGNPVAPPETPTPLKSGPHPPTQSPSRPPTGTPLPRVTFPGQPGFPTSPKSPSGPAPIPMNPRNPSGGTPLPSPGPLPNIVRPVQPPRSFPGAPNMPGPLPSIPIPKMPPPPPPVAPKNPPLGNPAQPSGPMPIPQEEPTPSQKEAPPKSTPLPPSKTEDIPSVLPTSTVEIQPAPLEKKEQLKEEKTPTKDIKPEPTKPKEPELTIEPLAATPKEPELIIEPLAATPKEPELIIEPLAATPKEPELIIEPLTATPSTPPPDLAPQTTSGSTPSSKPDDGSNIRISVFYPTGQDQAKDQFMNTLIDVAQKKSKRPTLFQVALSVSTTIEIENSTEWIWKAKTSGSDIFFVILPDELGSEIMDPLVGEALSAGLRCFLVPQAEIASKLLYMDLMVELMMFKRRVRATPT